MCVPTERGLALLLLLVRRRQQYAGIGALSPENCHLNSEVSARPENGRSFFLSPARTQCIFTRLYYRRAQVYARPMVCPPRRAAYVRSRSGGSELKVNFAAAANRALSPPPAAGRPSHPVYRVIGNGENRRRIRSPIVITKKSVRAKRVQTHTPHGPSFHGREL